jgi:integrase
MSHNGLLVTSARTLEADATRVTRAGKSKPSSAHVRLDGNIARRAVADREFIYWDTELPGFGLRTFRSGTKSWFVQFRQRSAQKRITLGKVGETTAEAARAAARVHLASVALDGLPLPRPARKPSQALSFREYAPRFWEDYARHWKPATRKRNHGAIFNELVTTFGSQPVDAIRRTDVLRWRDSCGDRQGAFNRTIPVMSVMMSYAEQLGLRPRGSNPCKGTPRYKRQPVERFLSAREFARLATSLRVLEELYPREVLAIRLIIYTGARRGEIEGLRWEWVQPPRLMLPDSKTGAKIVYLNAQAQAVLNDMPDRASAGRVFDGIKLNRAWASIRSHAALPDVRIHDLRHSFASIAIADGVSLAVVGKLLGHALAETTERYAHLADEAISDAARRVSGSLARCLGLAA